MGRARGGRIDTGARTHLAMERLDRSTSKGRQEGQHRRVVVDARAREEVDHELLT